MGYLLDTGGPKGKDCMPVALRCVVWVLTDHLHGEMIEYVSRVFYSPRSQLV